MSANGLNRLEDRFRLALAGLGDMLARSDSRRQQFASPASVLRGPRKSIDGRRDGPIGRILEDLVHFNNNLTPTAKDPAVWWCPPAAEIAAEAGASSAAGVCVTFGELNGRANFLARCLQRVLRAHGVVEADEFSGVTICAVMPSCPDRLALELAALKLGLPLLGLEEPDGSLGRLLDALQKTAAPSAASGTSATVVLVTSAGAALRLPDLRRLSPSLALQFEDLAEAGQALGLSDRDLQDDERPAAVQDADSASLAVAFTVETLGGRLVNVTQGQLLAAVGFLRDCVPWQCHEVLWLGDSCDSVYWRVHALSALLQGIPLLLCPGCARWDAWLGLLRSHYVTRLVTSPSFLTDLLAHTGSRPAARAQLASVEAVLVIGEPLPPRIADDFFHQLGSGRTLGCFYGCVEACGAAAYGLFRCPADVQEARRLSDCLLALPEAAPNVRLAVTDQRGRPLPAGQLGEIRLLLPGSHASCDVADDGATWTAGPSALRTGDFGQLTDGRLLCYGRADPSMTAAVEAAARLGWRVRMTPSGTRLLAQPASPECRRFTTAPLMRCLEMATDCTVGLLADWSSMPRRRLWELPDPSSVRRPTLLDVDSENGGGRSRDSGSAEAVENNGDGVEAWPAAALRLAEAATAGRSACAGRMSRMLSCAEPSGGSKIVQSAWESHLPYTEAAYRTEGPEISGGGIGSLRLLDRSGRVAALVEFRVIESGIVGAAAEAADIGFDAAACSTALNSELSATDETDGAIRICRALRVRFPQCGGGGASGGTRALRFLRLADLVENLLLHCAQLLGCGAALRVADDSITQALCQELGYRLASTRQAVQSNGLDVNGSFGRGGGSRSSASSRSSSVSSSSGGGGSGGSGSGGGSRGRGQAWESATVSEVHALCRSQSAVLMIRRVPPLPAEARQSEKSALEI